MLAARGIQFWQTRAEPSPTPLGGAIWPKGVSRPNFVLSAPLGSRRRGEGPLRVGILEGGRGGDRPGAAMSVTAKQLSKSGARGKDLDSMVGDQLRLIDDKLLHADRTWGRNIVSHDIPVALSLPGLDKKDAQRIVYSAILRSLDKRGFEVRILLEQDHTTVHIAWMTDLDVEEVEAMNALIRSKRIQREGLDDFLRRGSVAAPHSATAARQGRADPAPPMTVGAGDQVMRPRGGLGAPAGAGTRGTPAAASAAEAALLAGGTR
jgi:hypothetical protein